MTGDKNDAVRHKFPMQHIHPEDRKSLLDIFRRAVENPLEGASGEVRYIRSSGKLVCFRIRAFYLRENNGRKMIYADKRDLLIHKSSGQ